jgi:rhodanese-related sulfurtransferase
MLSVRLKRTADVLVIDVRGPDEFVGPLGHIGAAINMPIGELAAHLPDLSRSDRPVVVVCKTDRRSSLAARQLQDAGVTDVSVLRGGMEQWRKLGLPVS